MSANASGKGSRGIMRIWEIGVTFTALLLCLSGCGLAEKVLDALPEETLDKIVDTAPHTPSYVEETAASFLEAVEAQDAEAVRALFAPSALAEDADFDEVLTRLFTFYSGPTDECWSDNTPGISKHLHYGKTTRRSYSGWVPVVSQGVNYYCYVSVTEIDDDEPENIGINKLVFVTEKARCAPEFERPEGYGLWLCEDPPGDYQTCRINEDAYIYIPVDRTVTKEEIVAFLEGDASWKAFAVRFGDPNVNAFPNQAHWNVYYYALPEEDGEPRWARLMVEDGTITSVTLEGRSYHSEGVLWKPAS